VVIYGLDARGGGDITTTVDIKDLRGMPIEAFAANTPVWPHPQLRAG
jgi:hypothetical protein